MSSIIRTAAETPQPGLGDHQRSLWETQSPLHAGMFFQQSDSGSQGGDLPFLGLNKHSKAQPAPHSCRAAWAKGQQPLPPARRAIFHWGKTGGEYCDREPGSWRQPHQQLWIDHLCFQGGFFWSLSFLRALILMCFLWLVIWHWRNWPQEEMAFLGFSPQHALTGSSSCQWYPERVLLMETVPWTPPCKCWNKNPFVWRILSSPWTGAILSETISNSTRGSDLAQPQGKEETLEFSNRVEIARHSWADG